MAWALLSGGLVMWVVDARLGRAGAEDDVQDLGAGQAVWIGLCQTLSAIFPGLSRSMATITAGELAGISRATALEFSFLLSIPTMAAATGYDLLKAIRHPGSDNTLGALHIAAHEVAVLALGFAVSFVIALGTVAWLMRWVRRRGFAPFALYRILLGAAVLVWLWR
jgi:undecaprenyl-diphosphatase